MPAFRTVPPLYQLLESKRERFAEPRFDDFVSPWAFRTLPRRLGIVIAVRDRSHSLRVAVQACLDTSWPAEPGEELEDRLTPDLVLVVDDRSSEDIKAVCDSFGDSRVHYARFEGSGDRSCLAKKHGTDILLDLGLPYVCCVDSDDRIPPDYFEHLFDAIESDARCAVAYPTVKQFGARHVVNAEEFDQDLLSRRNFAPCSSLIRSDALRQVGGWPVLEDSTHEDWATWNRLVGHGWSMKLAREAVYYWHRHAASTSFTARSRGGEGCRAEWWRGRDQRDLVTIAIPFCGRTQLLEPMFDALRSQTFPLERCAFLAYDNSGDAAFGRELKDRLDALDCDDVRYVRDRTLGTVGTDNSQLANGSRRKHAEDVNHRVAGCWNRIGQLVAGDRDLVWCLEDDVIPPPHALERLLASFDSVVDAVSGIYDTRGGKLNVLEWKSLDPLAARPVAPTHGTTPAGAVGFGCVLMRRQLLRDHVSRSAGEGPNGHVWFDWNFWADVSRAECVVKANWDVKCDHRLDLPVARELVTANG